jgi:outer membrane protein
MGKVREQPRTLPERAVTRRTIPLKGGEKLPLMATLRPLPVLATVLLFATAPCSSAFGQPRQAPQDVDLSRPLALDDAIRIALTHQPALGIARARVDSARARVTQSASSYFPQIAPTVQYVNNKTMVGTTSGPPVSFTSEQTTSSITLRQLIYDTGKREANVAAARAGARSSEFGLLDTRQQIIQDVTTAWYEVLRRQELVKVQQANVDRAKTTLDATRAFADAGSSPRKDVLQAQADYDNAVVQLQVAVNDVRLAQTSLKNAMGLVTPLALVLPETQLPLPDPAPDKRTAKDYLDLALKNRPDLKRDLASAAAQRQSLRVAQIEAGVQVAANVTESYQFDTDRGEYRTFLATMTYPLFDGGLVRAQVRDARATLTQAQLAVEQTRQALQLAVDQAFISKEEARIRIGSTQSAVRAARENYAAARESQKEGAGTIIDVITAQAQLVTAETNAIQAIYDYYSADAQLQRAIGANDLYSVGGNKP